MTEVSALKVIIPPLPSRPESIYKTIYIEKSLANQIEQIAIQNNTSWNHVVTALLKSCLEHSGGR
ncbi:hypothetical protein OCV66_03885 [Agathobaculum ammoniilyticum]|uniref:CopG family transcriptional regulator n=1 Tax=Agathobaculum ammoniilyticum TaxID=2981778 RepID=A0ABT2U0T1_9FIRM|nr:hypothetical protein [Agathobaculum ammoniilyticum]